MAEEQIERTLKELPETVPSPETRDCVLRMCRQERESRGRSSRPLFLQRCFIFIVLILLLNVLEERRNREQIAKIYDAPPSIERGSSVSASPFVEIRERMASVTALMQDPNRL